MAAVGAGAAARAGRNDPCPCGSGRKYKRCCGGAVERPAAPLALPAQEDLARALAAFEADDLAGCEAACRALLAREPDNADALNLLGVALGRLGRFDAAAELIGRAASLHPGEAQFRMNLGNVHRSAGRPDQAVAMYEEALALAPRYADGWHNLALALADRGDGDAAAACLDRRLALGAGAGDAWALAEALRDDGRPALALRAYREALARAPRNPELMADAGAMLLELRRLEEAEALFGRAARLMPDAAELHHNLGNLRVEQGRYDDALACYRRALAARPDWAQAHYHLGRLHLQWGRLGEAAAALTRARELDPELAPARLLLGMLHLVRGDYAAGFPEYEWRWRDGATAAFWGRLPRPLWRGQPVAGRTVLLHAEQGLGDTLHFARYAPLLAERGARVLLHCQRPLARLLARLPGVAGVLAPGDALPHFDFHSSLLSLPLAFGTTLATIPAAVPYLCAAPEDAARWRERLPAGGAPRVGLAWAGNPGFGADARRSVPAALLAPLAQAGDLRFVSLQKEVPAGDPPPLPLLDFTAELHDFAETAALVANLDLVIAVDTAVAHLAGALGRPVWLLNRFDSDWRWMLDREDSPWYPTLRIFRQPRPFDWAPVTERVARELVAWREGRSGAPGAEPGA